MELPSEFQKVILGFFLKMVGIRSKLGLKAFSCFTVKMDGCNKADYP